VTTIHDYLDLALTRLLLSSYSSTACPIIPNVLRRTQYLFAHLGGRDSTSLLQAYTLGHC
jgi:hypothetical protein